MVYNTNNVSPLFSPGSIEHLAAIGGLMGHGSHAIAEGGEKKHELAQ